MKHQRQVGNGDQPVQAAEPVVEVGEGGGDADGAELLGEGRVAGYSMVQLISTSLISGHFANDTNNAYLDIFSCKGYDPAVVEAFSKEFFGARRSMATATLRY